MISNLDNTDENTVLFGARQELRLTVKPGTAARGIVDGAWWPRSTDPAAEFPALVMGLSSWVGPAHFLAYHPNDWDPATSTLIVENWTVYLERSEAVPPNTVVVTGPDQKQLRVLVVPPATPGGVARAVLRSTSRSDTATTVEEILASNGISAGQGNQPMTTPLGPADGTTLPKPAVESRSDEICQACRHPWRNHDQIAVRYCIATDKATDPASRGCVCTTKEF